VSRANGLPFGVLARRRVLKHAPAKRSSAGRRIKPGQEVVAGKKEARTRQWINPSPSMRSARPCVSVLRGRAGGAIKPESACYRPKVDSNGSGGTGVVARCPELRVDFTAVGRRRRGVLGSLVSRGVAVTVAIARAAAGSVNYDAQNIHREV
jgi:hypothetical protein